MSLPDPTPVLDLIDAFRASKTMFTAVAMDVFDRLYEAPAAAATLAAALGVQADALERLLDGCAALGLLRKADGIYSNQPLAEAYLCSSSPRSLHGYVRYSDEALYPMWAHLDDAVREGTNRWGPTFGLKGALFSHFFRTDAAMRDFLQGMHGFGMLTSPRVVEAFDLGRFGMLADLGGATGHLAIAACERYPQLRAVVFDLPRVTRFAREQVALSAAWGRIEVRDGDFFEDELPAADLFALGRILHDWAEPAIDRLLRRIFDRLPPGGGVLLAEKLLADDGVGPVSANLQSINMLICTEGKERSVSGYARLLRAAGFGQVEGRRTGAALDAVLALKPVT
jgi:acetylserotonin N-methyltransferase